MAKFFNRNISDEAHQRMQSMAGEGIRVFAMTRSGGRVIITNRNTLFARNIPDECYDKIKNYQRKGEKILCVAFHPRGGNRWSIITNKGFFNRNIPDECHDKMREMHNAGRCPTFVAFPTRGSNAWVVLSANGFYARNIPDECYQIMRNIHQGKRKVKSVAFDTDRNGWVVLAGDYFFVRNVDDELFTQMKKFRRDRWIIKNVVFDPDRRGWSISANSRYARYLSEPIRDYENKIKRKSIWQQMRDRNVPGVAVAAVANNRIAWSCGYGHLKQGEPHAVHPESLFQAASISKVIDALGILRAERMRLLDIDDDITNRLTSWTPSYARGVRGAVTIRQLLSHSGGINVGGFGGYPVGMTLPSLLQVLNGTQPPANSDRVRVTTTPGGAAEYSGGGFEILHQLLIDVVGGGFERWMQGNLLSRLGMDDTTFAINLPRAQFRDNNVAAGHDRNGNPINGDRNRYPESAAAGAYSNVLDLARMIICINSGGTVYGIRSLGQTQIADLLTPHAITAEGVIYGLGVRLNRRNRRAGFGFKYQHGGTNAGFRAAFIGFPNRNTGVAVMTNGNDSSLRWDVANAVVNAYGWASDT